MARGSGEANGKELGCVERFTMGGDWIWMVRGSLFNCVEVLGKTWGW